VLNIVPGLESRESGIWSQMIFGEKSQESVKFDRLPTPIFDTLFRIFFRSEKNCRVEGVGSQWFFGGEGVGRTRESESRVGVGNYCIIPRFTVQRVFSRLLILAVFTN